MKNPTLLQIVRDEPYLNDGSALRTIIRFANRRAFLEQLVQLQALDQEHPESKNVLPLPLINAFSCTLPGEARMLLSQLPDVDQVEEDGRTASVHQFFGPVPIGIPLPGMQSTRAAQHVPWGVNRIKAPLAWKKATGAKVKVGIIDTGIDFSHQDLQAAIGGGVNLIQRYMPPHDDNGHGTHIAGTIAAASKNGIMGVAPNATLYAVKAFDSNGTSYVSDIIQGIEWCIRNQIRIINMSFGMKSPSSALEAAVSKASQTGVIIVASSGNEGHRNSVDYPARYSSTIAVGATTQETRIASFSNRGKQIDIYAPGEKIFSTWLNGRYTELSGTSMATSHVSGVVALLLSMKPKLKTPQIISILQRTANPLATRSSKAGFLGEVDAIRTVKAAKGLTARRKAVSR